MACSIIRDKNTNEIVRVNAPNGQESKLYNDIVGIIKDKEEALRAWAKVYTPSFKSWFGDWESGKGSKVVDLNGEPLLVYHGGPKGIEEFRSSLQNLSIGKGGLFFTDNSEYTQEVKGPTENIYPVFLKVDNPENREGKGDIDHTVAQWSAEKGYDGVVGEDYGQTEGKTFVVFEPNQIKSVFNQGTFSEETGNIYKQIAEMPASKVSNETLNKVKEVIKKMGVSIETLTEYAKKNPDIDVKSLNGVADLVRGIVAFAEGREEALTEEMVHIATAILEQTNPKMVTEMIAKIDRFKIYKQTLEAYKNNKNYQLSNGKPDIRKIKKEAVDKLIAEVIVNQNNGSTDFPELMQEENQSMLRKWWNAILDFIRGMYNSSNINIFETVAGKIMGEDAIGTVAQIKDGEVFFQIAKNDAVDKYVDTIIDRNSRLKLFPEVRDASGKVIEKRHYKLDDKKVKETVTEKVKGSSNMPERTGLDKQMDDDKQAWGLEGHSYIENYIKQNLIDDKGYALANPTDKDIKSRLNPEMKKALRDFAIELVRSYDNKPGTRFLVEVKMVNEKVSGMIASTIDLKVISPDVKTGIKVDTYDWKFTSIDKNRTEDIPWYKRGEWKQQMGEYTKMDYSYGIKPEQIGKARMIPFIMNYEYAIPGEPRSGLVAKSIEVGKLDSLQETKLYLLPVVTNAETTGSTKVDELVRSLEQQYDKVFEKGVPAEKYDAKVYRLQQISKAIRLLQMKLNFEPLAILGESFLKDASQAFKEFENLDYSKLTKEQVKSKLQELNSFKNSAEKFESLDEVFISTFGKEGLNEENKKILASLEKVSAQTGRMMLKIQELQGEYAMQIAVKEDIVTEQTKKDVITAEREIDVMSKTFLEGSKLSSTIINLATKLIINAASLVNIKVSQSARDYGPLLLALEKEAKAQGKTAFDLIGVEGSKTLELIKKIDPKFYDKLNEAKKEKNKQFFLDNMDVAKYDELSKEAIRLGTEELNKMTFSLDDEEDIAQRNYKIRQLKNSLDIHSDTFNGYESFRFARIFKQVMKEEKHYSKEFKEMSKNKAALDMWTYMVGLNERAREMGYLTKQGNSFFPLMEASLAQKVSQGDNTFSELRDFFKDSYTVRIDEEQKFSKIDPETHKIKKQIPRLFTRTNKEVTQLSRDLNKVLALWTRSLLEYESNRELEDTLLTLHSVEKAKGRLLVDESDSVIMEGGAPKVDTDSNKNADILETIIDDKIYGLKENSTSLGNVALSMGVSKLSNKTDEERENTKISIKKGLETGNTLTRALAVGLKALVALPNWFGVQFQTFINAGMFYRMREFEKNNLRSTTGIGLSVIDRGLIDLIVPLNEDITKEKMRELAKEQGYIKYLSTWTFNDVMMITNSWPEKKLQIANALSFNDNAMVVNGKIVNIRQYLKKQDRDKYGLSFEERRALERTFEDRVAELKESSSLSKIAKIENDRVVIPGVSLEELAKYRTKVVEFGRELNGQMSDTNKADYRRDTMFRSFMMFKNWMPKLISAHTLDIKKNMQLDEWQYGRTRAFVKTWAHLGLMNIGKMRAIITGTEEGLAILDEMLEAKKADYFRKNGKELQITKEEFYDLIRRELSNQMKELGLLFGLMTLLLAARAAVPPDDADELTKNRYKWWMKLTNKVSDEIAFYYNPLSFEGMTSGSVIPSITLLSKAEKAIVHLSKEAYGYSTDNEEMMDKAHPTKYFLDLVPGPSQFNREILPLVDPELAKELGIRVTAEARQR